MSDAWVIVEQDEGLMVNVCSSGSTTVEMFMVDYDECSGEGGRHLYARGKIAECANSGLPEDHKDRIIGILSSYLPE